MASIVEYYPELLSDEEQELLREDISSCTHLWASYPTLEEGCLFIRWVEKWNPYQFNFSTGFPTTALVHKNFEGVSREDVEAQEISWKESLQEGCDFLLFLIRRRLHKHGIDADSGNPYHFLSISCAVLGRRVNAAN